MCRNCLASTEAIIGGNAPLPATIADLRRHLILNMSQLTEPEKGSLHRQ